MLTVLRFLRGYLTICFSGENAEKILNLCAKNNLNIWGMIYKKGKIFAKTDINSFKKIHSFKKNIKANIKIIKKTGFPFIKNKYKKRVGIIIGIVLFITITHFLSLFIWNISVEGNKSIKTKEILKECKDINITEGVKSSEIDTKNGPQKLMLNDERISWASFNIEGCNLTVNIREATNEKGLKNMPSNIKAKTDGIITKISATSGNVTVKQGDTVAKGDILISGVVEKLNSTVFTRSKGEIYAQTVRNFTAERKYEEYENQKCGKEKSRKLLKFFNLKIPLYIGKTGDINLLKTDKKHLKITSVKLPVAIYKINYYSTERKKVKHTKEKLKSLLNQEVDCMLKKENVISAILISENFTETEKGLKIEKSFLCNENICYEEEILVNSAN